MTLHINKADVLSSVAVKALGLDASPHPGFPTAAAVAAFSSAVEAGDLQLASLGSMLGTTTRTKSSARDLVTEIDVASERLITASLRAAAPDYTIQGEEEAMDEESDAPRWYVDPLDGTVNYVHGIPMFAVSIALYAGPASPGAPRDPLLGIVHAPKLGETFVAAKGRGAFLLESADPTIRAPKAQPLQVSSPDGLASAVLATGFPYRRNELPNSNLGNFNALFYEMQGVRRMGAAALDLAYVAAGRLDGYWELHLGAHDLAAGALLVMEAGGKVTDTAGGDTWLATGRMVAAPESVATPLCGLLRS